jgi:coenzyme F420-dependent glucose-6-phosphate dehydrogenase
MIGYFLSAEEHDGPELVRMAVQAERAGFRTASISDHFHPWLPGQGKSPFVWSVPGAIAQATTDLQLTTAVVCPTFRMPRSSTRTRLPRSSSCSATGSGSESAAASC